MKNKHYLLFAALVSAGCTVSAASAETVTETVPPAPFTAAVKDHGKWGAVNANGVPVVPIQYDAVDLSLDKKDSRESDLSSMTGRDQLIEVKSGKWYGFYDREGHEIVPVSYEARSAWVDDALAIQTEKNHIGFYRRDGQKLSDPIYSEASDFHDGFAIVKRDGKYGYLSRDEAVMPGEYKSSAYFSRAKAKSAAEGTAGKTNLSAIPSADESHENPGLTGYTSARYFKEGLAPVKQKKWGVINVHGQMVVPAQYDDTGPYYSDGLLAVKKDNKWGFIDHTGKEVVPLIYKSVHPLFAEGITAVQNDDKLWGFIDNKGTITAAPQFKQVVTPFAEGLAGVVTKDGKAYARPDGTIAFHADFDRIYAFDQGLAEYQVGELVERRRSSPISISIGWGWGWGGWHHHHPWGWGWGWPVWGPWWYDDWYAPSYVDTETKRGYIDASGKIIASASLDHVYPATKKGILVFNKNRFGWISKNGQYALHTEYRALIPDESHDFLLARNEEKRWGLVDFAGQVLAPFNYDDLKNKTNGFIAYKKDGKWGLLSADGKVLTKAVYDEIGNAGNQRIPVKLHGAYLYLDEAGNVAISLPKSVTEALPFQDGYAGIKDNGKWGIIDTEGHWTVKPTYEAYKPL